ncbi:hypothetical protein A9G10_02185 [Gilliamella sp. wkB308]|nr:hypothetical protein A9G10_02185 [Gilliamella apicola]
MNFILPFLIYLPIIILINSLTVFWHCQQTKYNLVFLNSPYLTTQTISDHKIHGFAGGMKLLK